MSSGRSTACDPTGPKAGREPAEEPPSPSGARTFAVLLVTGLGCFLASLDVSIANGLLPAIGADFHHPAEQQLSWLITAYAITFAAVLVPAARLADRSGRRRVYRAGLLLLALGSAAGGLAPNLPVLIAARVVQAAGAAAASPASLALLLAFVGDRRRALYTPRWAAFGGLGIALGPVLGGVITSALSWRWAFFIPLVLVAAALVAVPRLLAETPRQPGRSLPDPYGAVLMTATAAVLTLAISEVSTWGVADPRFLGCLTAAAVLGWGFVRRGVTAADPVLDLNLLHSRRIAAITATTVLYSCAFFGLVFSFTLFLAEDWHLPLLSVGLLMLPIPGAVMVVASLVGGLTGRFGFRPPLIAGNLLMGAGLALDALLTGAGAVQPRWFPIALLVGVGSGLAFPVLSAAAVDQVPHRDLAAASAINQAARQFGAALGISVSVAAIGPGSVVPAGRFHLAWLIGALACAGAAACATAFTPRRS